MARDRYSRSTPKSMTSDIAHARVDALRETAAAHERAPRRISVCAPSTAGRCDQARPQGVGLWPRQRAAHSTRGGARRAVLVGAAAWPRGRCRPTRDSDGSATPTFRSRSSLGRSGHVSRRYRAGDYDERQTLRTSCARSNCQHRALSPSRSRGARPGANARVTCRHDDRTPRVRMSILVARVSREIDLKD